MGTEVVTPDECCSNALSEAISLGKAETVWECPRCGVEWRPHRHEGITLWVAQCPVFVIR